MQKNMWKKGMNIFLCGLLGAAVLMAGCGDKKTAAAVAEKPAKQEQQLSSARNTPIVAAAKKVGPAVVGITNKAYVRNFWTNQVKLTERGTGSGVIYDKAGYIATNNHVVEGASEIIVSLPDGRSVKGKVLGADAATDLAVVKIDANNLTVAEFGDSDTLQVGEPAIAIGNPLGLEFRGSVTAGVISALNRSIEIGERKYNLIQTDAAINPGNSGGALVNADGEVVGINSAKIAVSGVEGIGFAIPVNAARPILKELSERGKVARPYLGISMMDKDIAARYGFEGDFHNGIMVVKVVPNSPAANAGINAWDIILNFNGKRVKTAKELRQLVSECKVGENIDVVIMRGGSTQTVTIKLAEVPEEYGN
ncbi:S1C family serine protease [Phascolarctobacterium sp.]|uniref:S1C family serine protease n=1 Tax=Phascolarctobacterium sp. TaxID=2049039 RepID=UPI00386D9C5C